MKSGRCCYGPTRRLTFFDSLFYGDLHRINRDCFSSAIVDVCCLISINSPSIVLIDPDPTTADFVIEDSVDGTVNVKFASKITLHNKPYVSVMASHKEFLRSQKRK